ncbi:MAG TPA: nucleotidyltransferase domain-containing protein [Blastocatellia bacterium]|nr:nucleotidyltransferase domain-containing protein [Blastocatellia bacterium]
MAATAQTMEAPLWQMLFEWEQSGANLRRRRSLIKKLCDGIARQFQPNKIILFGSYAYGRPNIDSDVDLLVILPFADSPLRQAGKMLGQIANEVGYLPMDLLVRTPEQVQYRLSIGDQFMKKITEKGKVMYEADHAGVGG